jgi:putative spermidine/putrescine transport system substrate-binding protein
MIRSRPRRWLPVVAVVATFSLVAACGDDDEGSSNDDGSDGSSGTTAAVPTAVGEGEGQLDIIAWAGYAEDGSTDPAYDWVTPFEDETGCETNVTIGNTSDEMVQLMQTGEYDGVSASGDATLRLIAADAVAPVNTDLVPTYADIYDFLKDQQYNSVDGQMYGIPHGWGANLLMFNTDVVTEAPSSWGAVFDPDSQYAGKVTAYDSPIYIADAALYLMKTQPDLGIENPYALDQDQFDAAMNLLEEQKGIIGEYWSDYLKLEEAFTAGSLVIGTTWQVIHNTLAAQEPPVPVETILPDEGATAWSDTWMISSQAAHPNCMYMWFDYITRPDVQAQLVEYYGEAPSNAKTCAETTDPNFCDTYEADNTEFHDQLWYWRTPTKECLDGRTDVDCVDYQEWSSAWNDLRAS